MRLLRSVRFLLLALVLYAISWVGVQLTKIAIAVITWSAAAFLVVFSTLVDLFGPASVPLLQVCAWAAWAILVYHGILAGAQLGKIILG
jgi:hypothetical protein